MKRLITCSAVAGLLLLMLLPSAPVKANTTITVNYGDVTLSGGFQAGHFDDVWDLTAGDIVISFTYDANGLVDDYGGSAHAWAELGVRSVEYAPLTVDLFADQNIDVGDVTINRVGDFLYVTYVTVDSWYLTETHLAVGDSLDDIPQKKGNPVPGLFAYSEVHDPPVQEYTYPPIDVSGLTPPLTIAAHAKVCHVAQICIVSDTATIVKERRSGDQSAFTTVNAAAVEAWEPGPNYPNDEPDDSTWEANSLWDQRIGTAYHSFFESVGADWIWETYRVADPVYGTVLKFERSFTVNGIPIEGKLTITCDNGYEAYLNDNFVGSDNVAGEWLTSDLKQSFVDTSNWDTVEQYDVSSLLSSGTNTLLIYAANEYFNTDDYGNPWPGTASNNPGGLIYALCIDYYDRFETAWGDGDPFPGKNWATYITYDVVPKDFNPTWMVEGSGVWLATDYDWTANTFDPDPPGSPKLDIDDKLILQKGGGMDEGYYNLPISPTQYWNNYGIWFDRDGVDQWQAIYWGAVDGGTYNTAGLYYVVITLHATSDTSGTAYMTVNGIQQGFYNGPWYNGQPALYPAGMTFTGDMKHLQVFYGLFGYGATHTVTFKGITVTQTLNS